MDQERLDWLDDRLNAMDGEAMSLSELDGFLYGVLVCPELILPDEWLPCIWAPEGEAADDPDPFADLEDFQAFLDAVHGLYNANAEALLSAPEIIAPLYEQDTDGSALWEIWATGFYAAISLRPSAWMSILEDPATDEEAEEARSSMALIATLCEVARGGEIDPTPDLEEVDVEGLKVHGAALMAACVATLNQRRLRRPPDTGTYAGAHEATNGPRRGKAPGRNEPCPCGSGRKYKKCCGAN